MSPGAAVLLVEVAAADIHEEERVNENVCSPDLKRRKQYIFSNSASLVRVGLPDASPSHEPSLARHTHVTNTALAERDNRVLIPLTSSTTCGPLPSLSNSLA